MKRFEYRLAKVNELAVATEEDTKNGRPNVTTVTLKDEPPVLPPRASRMGGFLVPDWTLWLPGASLTCPLLNGSIT